MLVLFFAHAVKLQIDTVLAGCFGGLAKLNVFGKANSVGCRKDSIEADLLRVSDGFEIVRRKRRLAAREENDDLPLWFERYGAIEDRFRVFVCRLVYITNLVCVHKARVAHHVAAVGEIDSQNRASAKLDVRRSVVVHVRIFGGAEVAAKKERFNTLEKGRIRGHHIDEFTVLRAGLTHNDLAVLFQNLCLDFARMLVHQRLESRFSGNDGVPDFFHATRAEAVGFARKAQRWRTALVRFQQGSRSPRGPYRFAFREPAINTLEGLPGKIGQV